MRRLLVNFVLVTGLALAGCAQAGQEPGDSTPPADAAGPVRDAAPQPDSAPVPDSAPPRDAAPIPDAPPPIQDASPPPDMGGGNPDAGGLLCTDSNQCGVDECCFILVQPPGFCVPGEEILGVCFPD